MEITSWCKRADAGGTVASPKADAEHLWVAGPFDFAPGDAAQANLEISLPEDWGEKLVLPGSVLVGSLTASFPSPGTGAALSVRRPIDVTLLSCCSPSWHETSAHKDFDGGSPQAYALVPACVLRSVFNVPSRKGLPEGSWGSLTLKPFTFGDNRVSILLFAHPQQPTI